MHRTPERVGIGPEHAGRDQPLVPRGEREQPMKEFDAGLSALRKRAAEVVAQRGLASQERGDDLRSRLDQLGSRPLDRHLAQGEVDAR